jgi:hypothetical protein
MKEEFMSSFSGEDYKQGNKKITEFSYLLQRKCLRMMRRYFKQQFESWGIFTNYKKEIRSLSLEQINNSIRAFIELEFDYLNPYSEYAEYTGLENSLKTLILCDRYNKNEPIIDGLNFAIIRNVLNKFNTRNLLNFYSDKANSLLFVHYYERNCENDAVKQPDVDPQKLLGEMKALYEEADKYMKLQLQTFEKERMTSYNHPEFTFLEEKDWSFLE